MIEVPLEAEAGSKIAHLPIACRVDGEHVLDPAPTRHVYQEAHQKMTKALALPLITDHDCTFAASAIGADAEAAHANLSFLAGIVSQCDERDLPLEVNVGQSLEHKLQASW